MVSELEVRELMTYKEKAPRTGPNKSIAETLSGNCKSIILSYSIQKLGYYMYVVGPIVPEILNHTCYTQSACACE